MRGKYRISEDRYDDFFDRLVRPKLVDFLSDERKRQRKEQNRTGSLTASHHDSEAFGTTSQVDAD